MFDTILVSFGIRFGAFFLVQGLLVAICVEIIASIFKFRARQLSKGIGELLNDPQFRGIAGELYAHAAINPRGPGVGVSRRNGPSYIDPPLFADALMDLTGISQQIANAVGRAAEPSETRPTLAALNGAVTVKCKQINNPQLEILLTGIVNRSFGEVDKIRTYLSSWFDAAMDRVSGAYKRWTQLFVYVVALILAIGLNLDAITIFKLLWTQTYVTEQSKSSQTERQYHQEFFSILTNQLPQRAGTKVRPSRRILRLREFSTNAIQSRSAGHMGSYWMTRGVRLTGANS